MLFVFRRIPAIAATARRPRKPPDQSLKETAESVVVAFILAFVFRAYIVEAFVIPTGSMAPTLLGQHVRAECDQCSYGFKADSGGADSNGDVSLRCPMCFNPVAVDDRPGGNAGDRILVQKYLYRFAEPRRFDVAVFKNPEDPDTNFIKRIVGLPGETLMLLDGNVYTRPDTHADWSIARKTDAAVNPRWERIQRDVFQPVYHSEFVPADGGEDEHRYGVAWRFPWQPRGDGWEIDITSNEAVLHWSPNQDQTATIDPDEAPTEPSPTTEPGELRFDFSPARDSRADYGADAAMYPYNQPAGSGLYRRPLEDLRLAAAVTPAGDGLTVTLQSTARLDGPPVRVAGRFHADGNVELLAGPGGTVLRRTTLPPFFRAGQPTSLELWVVDQGFLLWVDGEVALRHHLDLAYDQLLNRPAPPLPDQLDLRITVAGDGATLRDLELDRDLYYDDGGTGSPFRAGLPRNGDGTASPRHDRAVGLELDHFFMVGDNAPQSEDSRKWRAVNPYVAQRYFDGRRGPDIHGRVPRDLLMGRAFLVYYPAPRSFTKDGLNVLPNVGEIRFIH